MWNVLIKLVYWVFLVSDSSLKHKYCKDMEMLEEVSQIVLTLLQHLSAASVCTVWPAFAMDNGELKQTHTHKHTHGCMHKTQKALDKIINKTLNKILDF